MYDISYAQDAFQRKKIGTSILGLDQEVLGRLKTAGLTYASDFLMRGRTREERELLSANTGIDYPTVLYLAKCCDLLRLLGVSRKTLQYLYETGFDCVGKLKAENPDEVADKVNAYMRTSGLKSGMPPCCSVEEVVRLAKIMPDFIKDFD